jgi:hypothetical protein
MFTLATAVSLLAISAIAPSARALPSQGLSRHQHRDVPAQFQERGYKVDEELLEPYDHYHERYLIFHCEKKHDTAFWDKCCHPLLKEQTEDDLPDICFQDVSCDPSTTTSHKPKPTDPPHTSKPDEHHTSTTTKPPQNPAHTPSTTSSPHPEPTTSTGGGGGGGGGGGSDWYTNAFGTYYYQNGNAGACGQKHDDGELIVAINVHFYGDTGKKSPYCGKTVEIINLDNGNSVKAIVADACPSCSTPNSMDLSVGTFKKLEPNLDVGMFPIKWRVL